ncbi:hypothetical protein K490DRAFT_52209 [Saccharata proteae CBS 121410]|uniref:Exoribonuclease phosphorolytic domain-containing protein n=1 Tax=Saccharata proteae CBS 121410 TaxID=1314787 RepID=A0A9P4LSY9_9PEZI|nr:hypothetical protein K490DRAFT_52209 [Saccharata proteae CBS 121410]
MTDRRRTNAPAGGTHAPVFASTLRGNGVPEPQRPSRTRKPEELRKIFLKTGLTPSASGSAYLELHPSSPSTTKTLAFPTSSLKLSCTVHGPHPLPRSAPFSPHLQLSTTLKYAPFATRQRRGYVRDNAERDLGQHLEAALRGVVIGERWPKSGVDVVVSVIEGEEDCWGGDEVGLGGEGDAAAAVGNKGTGWGLMNVLAGCVTVASAAMSDAGIDCVDLVSGGAAALVRAPGTKNEDTVVVLDPSPEEHRDVLAACVVGYLAGRDEITELWLKGDPGTHADDLIESAVKSAVATRTVLVEAVKEAAALKFPELAEKADGGVKSAGSDVEMTA